MNKLFVCFYLLILFSVNGFAQESSLQISADIMSRYIWRGVDLGAESPSIQPTVKYVFNSIDTTHSIALGAWGAYNFNTVNQEVDFFATYTFKNLVFLNVTDYYFPGTPSYTKKQARYFNYEKDSTGHVLEASLGFNGTEKIPVTLLFAMNFYGNDARKVKDDGTNGNIFMSKYIEVGYKKTIKDIDFNAFVGAALDDPDEDKGELGFYGLNKSAGIVNIGIKAAKKIKITENYSLPIQASVITNPEAEKIYITFGISF